MRKGKNIKPACDAAVKYGIDLSLLDVNLKKTPAKRIADMSDISQGISELRNAVSKIYAK